MIKRNDVLFTIDQHDVYKQTIDQVRPLILGLPGSTVVLGFQRQGMITMRSVTPADAPFEGFTWRLKSDPGINLQVSKTHSLIEHKVFVFFFSDFPSF